MSGVRRVVWDEWCESVWDGWCEMNGVRWRRWVVYGGERWVVRDQWWKMSVVRDECVYEALCEMSESSVRCECMWDIVWDEWDEWCEMVVRDERCQMNGLKKSGVRTATPNTVYTRQEDITEKFFASPIGTATPNTVYTQQGAKPARQEDITANFSQLLLAQLPRTQFTHSKAPNPHASKTSPYFFRISYWHSYPEHSLHTARRKTRMPRDISTKFSHLLLARLPPTTFTHSKFIYTQQAAKPACQQHFRIS